MLNEQTTNHIFFSFIDILSFHLAKIIHRIMTDNGLIKVCQLEREKKVAGDLGYHLT